MANCVTIVCVPARPESVIVYAFYDGLMLVESNQSAAMLIDDPFSRVI